MFATGNSQPPAESLRGEEGMGSVSAEVPRPDTAGSLSMTIIIQKLHSQDSTDLVTGRRHADSHSQTQATEWLMLRSTSSDQSPAPHPRLRMMTSSSARKADSHANYCLLSTPPSGGPEKGGSTGEVEFSGCSHGMAPFSAVPPELVTDKNKRIQLPLSKSFSDFKHRRLHSSVLSRPFLQRAD